MTDETFIGEPITPAGQSFSAARMARGAPGLPRVFSWRGAEHQLAQVLAEWKESGDCRHGAGERYIRKHWFRVLTADGAEWKLYFERQKRSAASARWHLYTVKESPSQNAGVEPLSDVESSAG